MNAHPATSDESVLLRDCRIARTRRSGPGGQHRNKVETAIVIEHLPTGVRAEASERRSQAQNRQVAIRRLRINLALHIRTATERVAQPSDTWLARREGERLRVSQHNATFPALLAEALDSVASHDFDILAAATHLGISTSQLVKLLKVEERALRMVNDQRSDRGLRALQ